jgi:hypothetical protein
MLIRAGVALRAKDNPSTILKSLTFSMLCELHPWGRRSERLHRPSGRRRRPVDRHRARRRHAACRPTRLCPALDDGRQAVVRRLQPALRAWLDHRDVKPSLRRMDGGVRRGTIDRRASRSPDPPRSRWPRLPLLRTPRAAVRRGRDPTAGVGDSWRYGHSPQAQSRRRGG